MNIYAIISKEATEKYADTYLAYNYYEKTVTRLEEICVVSEDRAIEVLGSNNHDGKQVL